MTPDDRDAKLRVVVRADLSAGARAAQIAHAVADFHHLRPTDAARWATWSDSVIICTVPDEAALMELAAAANARGVGVVCSREPDYGDEWCALALSPGVEARKVTSSLKLLRAGLDVDAELAAVARERGWRDASAAMADCEQMPGLSVFDHGRMVRDRLFALLEVIARIGATCADPALAANAAAAEGWRLPAWVFTYADQLVVELPHRWALERYTVCHDIGKPACAVVGADGRRRFPGHAEASAAAWSALAGGAPDPVSVPGGHKVVGELIAGDMWAHTMSSADVAEFAASPWAATWLLVALAEVHANADLFGGPTSDGFKAKVRHLERRGRAVCRARYGDEGVVAA